MNKSFRQFPYLFIHSFIHCQYTIGWKRMRMCYVRCCIHFPEIALNIWIGNVINVIYPIFFFFSKFHFREWNISRFHKWLKVQSRATFISEMEIKTNSNNNRQLMISVNGWWLWSISVIIMSNCQPSNFKCSFPLVKWTRICYWIEPTNNSLSLWYGCCCCLFIYLIEWIQFKFNWL